LSRLFIIFSFFHIFLFCNNLNAINIATINTDYILEKSNHFSLFLNELASMKTNYENKLKNEEKALLAKQKEIENSKLLLSEEEISQIVNKYNIDVNNFQKKINNINENINNNIELNRNLILKEIVSIVKVISQEKKYDLILDQNNYFISSDNIDISSLIVNNLNKQIINLNISPL